MTLTMICDTELGMMWVRMMRLLDSPMTRAAPMYWASLLEMTTPRTIRAMDGTANTAMAMTVF